jgi:hypothetical protein
MNGVIKIAAVLFALVQLSYAQEAKSEFVDKGSASFEILKSDEYGYAYKIVETNYQTAYIDASGKEGEPKNHFIKKITTTKAGTNDEGQERNIKAFIYPFANPKQTVLTIDKECDNIEFDTYTYKTTIWGCCADESQYEIFDYKNRSIIKADERLAIIEAPNSNIKLYIGYKKDDISSKYMCNLTISYDSSNKQTLRIKKASDNVTELCEHFSPLINIEVNNKTMLGDQNRYELWSLNKIQNKNQMDGFDIKLTFYCEDGEHMIKTPIVKGKFFGKEQKTQEINLSL